MQYIIISPFARKLRNNDLNPKNYPYWDKVIKYIHNKNISVKQIGTKGEHKIDGLGDSPYDDYIVDLPFDDLKSVVNGSLGWLSIDNFFPHFCKSINKPGIVIFSQSDPLIFGYKENINLLKDRKYLRPDQFGIWEQAKYNIDAFIEPEKIYSYLRI